MTNEQSPLYPQKVNTWISMRRKSADSSGIRVSRSVGRGRRERWGDSTRASRSPDSAADSRRRPPGDRVRGAPAREQPILPSPSGRGGRSLWPGPPPTAPPRGGDGARAGQVVLLASSYFRIRWRSLGVQRAALGWPAGSAAARARRAMLGGVSGAREREAEGDGAGAVPAPPAIDFPAEGSDPKYDGEGPRRPRGPSPFAVRLHSWPGRQLRSSPQDLDRFGWIRA